MRCGLLVCGVLLAATVSTYAEPAASAGQSLAISGTVTINASGADGAPLNELGGRPAALGASTVPEPSTLLLFGSSLAGVGAVWRRYRHS